MLTADVVFLHDFGLQNIYKVSAFILQCTILSLIFAIDSGHLGLSWIPDDNEDI